ncbi:F-box/LRR-repeat protein 15-like [Montipora capricornis]|uniref:F-box/LRR-repeat protein 15-like n=1 Tax=Montipora foliosa TaxID=591990 RepID=UPI0035F18552
MAVATEESFHPKFLSLPWEDVIFLHIFPHFTIPQLFNCRKVCKSFREACDSYFAWQKTLDCSQVSSRLTAKAFSLITQANSSLQVLVLKNCKSWLDEAVLVEILRRSTRLCELDLTACSSLTNLTLFTVAEFNLALKVLKLRECRWVSSDAIIQVSLCCTGLQRVDLTGCWEVTDSCVSSLASCCTGLDTLLLNDCYSVSDNSIRTVASSCPKLFHLGLKGCWRVSNSAVKMIGEYCPNLETLEVKDCRDISEASLARLRVRGVMIDVGRTKRLTLHPGLYGYVEQEDWRIPVVNLNI